MGRKKIATTVYLTVEQDVRLKQLHQRVKVPVAELIRQGVDMVLARYEAMQREHEGNYLNGRAKP